MRAPSQRTRSRREYVPAAACLQEYDIRNIAAGSRSTPKPNEARGRPRSPGAPQPAVIRPEKFVLTGGLARGATIQPADHTQASRVSYLHIWLVELT